ncbi:MAG: acetyl-CoA carboxylase carboxyl transferase subunit beta, partial [Ignavibacteria bacterium]
FAGPRVVKQATGKDLPSGFQRSEFLLEHGFIDFIVNRKDMKDTLSQVINLICV